MTDFSTKTFGLISLGCDKNRVDAEKLLADIKSRGYSVSDEIEKVNILIINTCSFLEQSRKEAIETVIDCASYKDGCLEKIVVTGCLPQKFIVEIADELTEADVFLGTYDYDKFFEALDYSYSYGRVNYVGKGDNKYTGQRVVTTPCHYAYLKIADGCNNKCTYCLIPKIRGRYFSYPMDELIAEAEALGDISELILVAQDVTRYGIDLYGEKKLCEILQKLTALDNINSVRLLYCYPEMIDGALIAEIKNNDKIVKYLDIPFQHSEDRILKLMNRKGSRDSYLELIARLRSEIKGIAIRSTFICGFPSETEEESDALARFLRQAKLTNCGFFAYSREKDTPAYRLKDQIPYAVKKRRVKNMYAVQKEVSANFLSGFVGKKIRVLCDGINYDKNCFEGRAYFSAPDIDGKVYFNAFDAEQGKFYDILITSSDSYDLYGRTEDYVL
ncbi:MAG: 30S ribosomal protein S12 methylthiotransferase RimO [Clostridia bacterium]|nr:30S ribosomal protein S12 methylthiotransferase RimO [Clostridia bacterium]